MLVNTLTYLARILRDHCAAYQPSLWMETHMANFEGKTVIVTGGGGIGGATSKRFAADGAKVAVFDMNVEAAQKVVD